MEITLSLRTDQTKQQFHFDPLALSHLGRAEQEEEIPVYITTRTILFANRQKSLFFFPAINFSPLQNFLSVSLQKE